MSKKTIIIIWVTAAVAASLYWFWKPDTKPEVQRNLTKEESLIYKNRIKSAKEALKNLESQEGHSTLEKSQIMVNIGAQYYGLGYMSQAENWYDDALKVSPGNVGAWQALYNLHLEQGNYDQAREAINKAIDAAPANSGLWQHYITLQQERFSASPAELENLYQQALEKAGRKNNLLAPFARLLEDQGKIPQALEIWEELLKNSPKDEAYSAEIARLKGIKR